MPLSFFLSSGNYLLKEIWSSGCSFNPFESPLLGGEQGALQCLGTHLEGPLDASTSPVRQHSAARAGCCRVNVQYHGACKCPELLRAGRHSPGQTRRLRRFQGFCWKFGTGDPSRSLLPLCSKSTPGLYSLGMRIFQKMSEHQNK